MTTFLEACKCGDFEIVKFMIEKGENDISFYFNRGMMHACYGGHKCFYQNTKIRNTRTLFQTKK